MTGVETRRKCDECGMDYSLTAYTGSVPDFEKIGDTRHCPYCGSEHIPVHANEEAGSR